jgi:hypothetical protein
MHVLSTAHHDNINASSGVLPENLYKASVLLKKMILASEKAQNCVHNNCQLGSG